MLHLFTFINTYKEFLNKCFFYTYYTIYLPHQLIMADRLHRLQRPWEFKNISPRKTPVNPFYASTAWRKLRSYYITNHPLCEHCAKVGKITPADDVDHIRPINPVDAYDQQGGIYGDPLDVNNLQALCKACHTKKTNYERIRG